MMVETCLESSQDFGMSNGTLPQWKRELLQRRAARSRPAAPPPAPPPPPPPPPLPPADDNVDEELRYGPGIVKRLKSRYLSLALRDAPRRRPSVLRRAASLEHLLDERPPPAPRAPRPARPSSVAARPAPLAALVPLSRRESVKRARSVDALSRLESHEEPLQPPPAPTPRPPGLRAARPPRRPTPLLRDAERPPPDVVRSALRKFESAPSRRAAPAARVSAVLRGLEGPRRSLTPDRQDPELRPSSPAPTLDVSPSPASPPAPPLPLDSPPTTTTPPSSPPPVPAPSSESPPPAPLVSFAAVITPVRPECEAAVVKPAPAPRGAPTGPDEVACDDAVRAVSRAALEGIARAGISVRYAFEAPRAASHLPPLAATNPVLVGRRVGVIRPMPASPRARPVSPPPPPPAPAPAPDKPPEERLETSSPETVALVNGHSTPEPRVLSRIGAAGIERAWSGSVPAVRRTRPAASPEPTRTPSWARGPPRPRAPAPAATSIVFNFSNRKEVPDYIENDGIILRASRRNRIKAGETGVVVLRPEALAPSSDTEGEEEADGGGGGPPSPCAVRFLNDNVLINGRSSMPARVLRDPHRTAKLKLQFDDSLTRTFEYPSETSMCEEDPPEEAARPPPPAPAPAAAPPHLADNTHIASAVLSRYTPSKTTSGAFQLGVTSPPAPASTIDTEESGPEGGAAAAAGGGEERAHAVPCGADAARSWSESRVTTDLLF